MALLIIFPLFMITVLVMVLTAMFGGENCANISDELRSNHDSAELPIAA